MVLDKTDMLGLGQLQAQLFVSNNVAYCETLVTCDCPRKILVMTYERLVRQRKIIPIEDMLQDQKQTAWDTAKEIAKGRLGRKALVEVVQALLTIEYFLNL